MDQFHDEEGHEELRREIKRKMFFLEGMDAFVGEFWEG